MPVPTVPQDLPAESPKRVCNLCPDEGRGVSDMISGSEGVATATESHCRPDRSPGHGVLRGASFPEQGEGSYENRR
jgi:hypothetical protein